MKHNSLVKYCFLIFTFLIGFNHISSAQTIHIKGKVINVETLEAIPFATVSPVGQDVSRYVTQANENGQFVLTIPAQFTKISASIVGYETQEITLTSEASQDINIYLLPEENQIEEIVIRAPKRTKYSNRNNPAVELIRQVIAHRDENRLKNHEYVEYEQYEKVSLGLSNLSEKFLQRKALKNYQFLFEQEDAENQNQTTYSLPAYIEERLSKVYQKRSPNKTKQLVLAEQRAQFDPKFVDNDGLSSYFNRLYEKVDIYDNNISLVTNQFLSPIANSSPTFYRFYITDTIKTETPYLVELSFFPRNKADMLFQGKLYVTLDGKYAVKSADLGVAKDINLNFVRDLHVRLSFNQDENQKYFLENSNLLLDFSLTEKGSGIKGNRTVLYSDFKTDVAQPDSVYAGSAVEIAYNKDNEEATNDFLSANRPLPLAKNELTIYSNIEDLQLMPGFKRVMDIASLVFTGYKQAGPVEIGPVNTFYSFNPVEGFRLRVGGRTTEQFSKKFYAETYVAYGFRDEKWKYFLSGTYSLNNKSVYTFPMHYIRASFQRDTKIPGQNLDFVQEDNFLLSFKRGENERYLYNDIYRLEYKKEFENNFSYSLGFSKWKQSPAGILTYQVINPIGESTLFNELNTTELSLGLRYAPHEEFYQGKLYRTPIYNKYPIFYFNYTAGVKGFLEGEYNYHNFTLGADKRFYLSQFGYADINLEGKYLAGDNIPFPLLTIHRANQTYAYQLASYNLMNFLEFVSDRSVSTNVQYYMNGFLLNKIPVLKKLKWREVFSFKAIWGDLRPENNPNINSSLFQFQRNENDEFITYALGNKPYMEASAGLTNIFKFLRVDVVKRLNYLDQPNVPEWGVRARFKFDF
ncbi:DUF5686 and carboxypeptidase-like regulatory domain-containing protein [Sphingobacterium hungaricum]